MFFKPSEANPSEVDPSTPRQSPRTRKAGELRARAEGAIYAPVKAGETTLFERRRGLVENYVQQGLEQYDRASAEAAAVEKVTNPKVPFKR